MQPILREIPEHFETERLSLRALRIGDGAAVLDAVQKSVAELRQWMLWAQGVPKLEDCETFARRAVASFAVREQLHMLIFSRSTGELIGNCGMNKIDWNVPHGQIGYWLRSSQTGRGYMIEAVNGWTQFAFSLGFIRIEIRCDDRNLRSARVAERAGYGLDGVFRHESRDPQGNLRDTRVYSRIAGA